MRMNNGKKGSNRIIITIDGGCVRSVFSRDDITLEIINWDEHDKELNPYHSFDLKQWEEHIEDLEEIY